MSDMKHVMVYRPVAFFRKWEPAPNWLGATSLWRVLTGMPSSSACISRSFIRKAATRVGGWLEVMVFQCWFLLASCPIRCADQQQVRTGGIRSFVYQEYSCSQRVGHHFLHFRVEVTAHVHGGFAHSTQGFQQWRFVVQQPPV